MRLINCRTGRFEEFFGQQVPDYAILSHTWDTNEVSFKEFYHVMASFSLVFSDVSLAVEDRVHKIINTCAQARKDGYKYVWIDNCCIDKSSSAELTEAINSMYKWYQNSRRCYVYLSDFELPADFMRRRRRIEHIRLLFDPRSRRKLFGSNPFYKEDLAVPDHLRKELTTLEGMLKQDLVECRWFSRGWTLQELLAPGDLAFYDRYWYYVGSRFELADALSSITLIPRAVLNRTTNSYSYCAAQKMSWAASRQTTREEDTAYCLFGLFGVNLPLLYGEGGERAFIRLQEEIMKESNDLTLFAWQDERSDSYRGILARSPREFRNATNMVSLTHVSQNPEFTVTNKGLRIQTPLARGPGTTMFMPLNCASSTEVGQRTLGVYLVENWGQIYRDHPHELPQQQESAAQTEELIYIMKNTVFSKSSWKDYASVLGPERARPDRTPDYTSTYEPWQDAAQADMKDFVFSVFL